MTTQEQYIARLEELAQTKFGREVNSRQECEALAESITQNTGIVADIDSLTELFCSQRSNLTPRPSTLTALARYVGYDSWIDFCTSRDVIPADDVDIIPVTRRWGVIILTIVAILLVIGTSIYLIVDSPSTPEKSAPRTITIELATASVEEEWLAATTEMCNTIRAYYGSEEYDARITEYSHLHTRDMDEAIRRDVEDAINHHHTSFTEADIDARCEAIATECRAMLEALRYE